MPTKSHNGYEYFVTWVDDKSHKVFIARMHEKSEVTQHLKAFISWAEVKIGQNVGTLHSDRGGKYIAGEAQHYLEEKGIKHKMTMPHTPQHNGVAKCMNWTLLDKVQAMLVDAGLPESFWYDALSYATHIHHITPTCALEGITPKEAWSSNKPDISHLRIFGAHAFVHVPDKLHSKLGSKSLICMFLRFAIQHKAYHLIHHPTGHLLESCDVIFDKGGPKSHYKQTVIKHDNAQEGDTTTTTPNSTMPPSSSSTSTSAPTPSAQPTPPANSQPAANTTTAPSTCPRHTICTPIRDDGPRYSVTSYDLKSHTTEHASIAQVDTT